MFLVFFTFLACAHCDMTIFEEPSTRNSTWIKKYSENQLMAEQKAFKRVIGEFYERYRYFDIDVVVARENQYFLFGAALASELNVPFVFLENGPLKEGQRVLFIDNIVKEGTLTKKACDKIELMGAKIIEVACIIEHDLIKGRNKIPHPLFSLLCTN